MRSSHHWLYRVAMDAGASRFRLTHRRPRFFGIVLLLCVARPALAMPDRLAASHGQDPPPPQDQKENSQLIEADNGQVSLLTEAISDSAIISDTPTIMATQTLTATLTASPTTTPSNTPSSAFLHAD